MKLVGLMPVRNEDWILGLSARVALQWCDALVILLHACTDRSVGIVRELMEEVPGCVQPMACDGEWLEMEHRQHMLLTARRMGATHIAMIDADEVLTANLINNMTDMLVRDEKQRIRQYVARLEPGQMLELPGYNLRGSLDRYHSNGIWGQRWFSVAFKDTPEAHWAGDKFHSRNPAGVQWKPWRPIQQGEGGVMHLWGASERRLRAKHALYKVTERLRWPAKPAVEIDRMYNLWRSPADVIPMYQQQQEWAAPWTFATLPKEWTNGYSKLEGYLRMVANLEDNPWQEAEVQRLVAEHGKETFQGLDLFGLV